MLDKVDEDGNLLFGSEFTMRPEGGSLVTITNNGDGTFDSPMFPITEMDKNLYLK